MGRLLSVLYALASTPSSPIDLSAHLPRSGYTSMPEAVDAGVGIPTSALMEIYPGITAVRPRTPRPVKTANTEWIVSYRSGTVPEVSVGRQH